MRDPTLACALLALATGLALGFTSLRRIALGVAAFLASLVFAVVVPAPAGWQDGCFLACWTSIVVCALSVHLPRERGIALVAGLAINAGVWSGLLARSAGAPVCLWIAAPGVAVAGVSYILVQRRMGVVVKVAASWLIAIAGLEALLSFIPTPGYRPDHMD